MTPQEAQSELARRELARRELARRSTSNPETIQQSGQFGGISKTPTMIESAITNLTSPKTKPIGMSGIGDILTNPVGNIPRVALSASGIPEEDVLPAVGQAIGGSATGFTGAGLLGATAGATLGQGIRQLAKVSRGQEGDLSALPKEAVTTGAVEGLTRGTGNFLFRRQIGNELLGNLGKQLGEMKQAISSNPNLSIPSEQIYMPMKQAMEEVAVPHGPQSTIINKWLKFMENNPALSGRHLIELEKDLGEVAKYGEMSKGAFIPPTNIKKPALNTIAKTSRTQVSNEVDRLAEKGGQKGFGTISKKISKILSNPSSHDITSSTGSFGQRLVGSGALATGVGMATGSPVSGATTYPLAYFALQALQNPELRNLAFKATKEPITRAVGTSTKLGISELLRRLTGSK